MHSQLMDSLNAHPLCHFLADNHTWPKPKKDPWIRKNKFPAAPKRPLNRRKWVSRNRKMTARRGVSCLLAPFLGPPYSYRRTSLPWGFRSHPTVIREHTSSLTTRSRAAGHGFGVPSTSPQCSAWTHGCNPPTAGSGAPASSSIGSDRAWNDFDDGALTKHKQDARSRPSWKSIDHPGNRSAGVFDARLGVARRARWYLFGTPDRIFADEDRPADDWTI